MTLNSPPSFTIGQCWTSEGEPELGLGFVKAIDEMSVAIEFPSATQARLYRKRSAPLRRLELRVGEKALPREGDAFVVERVEVRDRLFWYFAKDGRELCETQLSPRLTFQRPIERFVAGQIDPLPAYLLRQRSLSRLAEIASSPARGFVGPRALLLPHQLYVTKEVTSRGLPRALLADEVGLGKTIEAGWILHRLWVTGRMRRVLIIAPEALVNQWFVELFKRFNLSFWVPSSQSEEDELVTAEDLAEQERVILSLESLAKLRAEGKFDAAAWDLVIVDEAHRVAWAEGTPSAEYLALESLARKSPGLLLLTATPELLGIDGHFSRLHLIDPRRFPSLAKFREENARYRGVAQLANELLGGAKLSAKTLRMVEKLLQGKVTPAQLAETASSAGRRELALALVDHFGTGRVYFRNSRSVVELENFSFPKRNLVRHPLKKTDGKNTTESFTEWLAEFARENRGQKTLLICNSARRATEWERRLRDEFALKAVAFHEELSLLARDRNAAYFADPDGASILLCSEIGGEGRNFQQAAHLVLADLPYDPDILEQRIGRLDRIGQKSDIQIHVPYFAGSREELALRWHEEVFDGFRSPTQGARAVYERYRDELESLETSKKSGLKTSLDSLLARAGESNRAQLAEIEAGRDRLIELNSFDPVEAPRIAAQVAAAERPDMLREDLESLFDGLGISSDDLDETAIFVEPGHSQYAGYFPGLPAEGASFTLSREQALARDDLALLSWDHPLVHGALESIAHQEFGNVSVAAWSAPLLVVEFNFVLEPPASSGDWYAEEFFPRAPVRILLEGTGKELTAEWTAERFRSALTPLPPSIAPLVRKIPVERIRGLMSKAQSLGEKFAQVARATAEAKMQSAIEVELVRLRALREKNLGVSDQEIQWWEDRRENLRRAFAGVQTRLDSFLLAVPSQLGA